MDRFNSNGKIPRASEIPKNIRPKNEEEYANIMGQRIHDNSSWYKNIYDFYQSNEV